MDAAERAELIRRYAEGPKLLADALARVPPGGVDWRPAPGAWSAHEVIGHCADSETIASTRIRFLVAEDRPTIQGYDESSWARTFDYSALPIESALRQVEQVRAWTVDLLRRLPESAWTRTGTHTESGAYSAAKWLRTYAEHLETHARQIDRSVAAWKARGAAAGAKP